MGYAIFLFEMKPNEKDPTFGFTLSHLVYHLYFIFLVQALQNTHRTRASMAELRSCASLLQQHLAQQVGANTETLVTAQEIDLRAQILKQNRADVGLVLQRWGVIQRIQQELNLSTHSKILLHLDQFSLLGKRSSLLGQTRRAAQRGSHSFSWP